MLLKNVTGTERMEGTDEHGRYWREFDATACDECGKPIKKQGWLNVTTGKVICDKHVVLE